MQKKRIQKKKPKTDTSSDASEEEDIEDINQLNQKIRNLKNTITTQTSQIGHLYLEVNLLKKKKTSTKNASKLLISLIDTSRE